MISFNEIRELHFYHKFLKKFTYDPTFVSSTLTISDSSDKFGESSLLLSKNL